LLYLVLTRSQQIHNYSVLQSVLAITVGHNDILMQVKLLKNANSRADIFALAWHVSSSGNLRLLGRRVGVHTWIHTTSKERKFYSITLPLVTHEKHLRSHNRPHTAVI
jgi:hypothetical protein